MIKELMIEIANIDKIEVDYKEEVKNLYNKAIAYLESQKWCGKIKKSWLAENHGYILCVFYFEIEQLDKTFNDEEVWIIVGDLPTAYIDIESAKDSKEAIECYVFLMDDWATKILNNESLENAFPVIAEPTSENALALKKRLDLIRKNILGE